MIYVLSFYNNIITLMVSEVRKILNIPGYFETVIQYQEEKK